MKRIIIIFFILFSYNLIGQNYKISQSANDTTIYSSVNKNAMFLNGEKAMYQFIYSKMNFKKIFEDGDVQGFIKIEFIVGKDGSLSNIKVIKSLDQYCDNDAVRVVKLMPKWSPGEINGQKVRTKKQISIKIKLEY